MALCAPIVESTTEGNGETARRKITTTLEDRNEVGLLSLRQLMGEREKGTKVWQLVRRYTLGAHS